MSRAFDASFLPIGARVAVRNTAGFPVRLGRIVTYRELQGERRCSVATEDGEILAFLSEALLEAL